MKVVTKALRLLWFHRQMLWVTTLNDIKSRYRGSVVGLVWLVLYPALFLGTVGERVHAGSESPRRGYDHAGVSPPHILWLDSVSWLC